jgi:outer membrane PBP1 activator LpoA protein
VPLSGPNADRGQALVHAAQLALDQPGSPPLDVRDTGGTPQGAAAAASAAIAAGAGIIIGPLTSAETAAVAAPARQAGVAVLAFTSDPAQAQPGVWTLGLTPAQQVRRLVGATTAQGKTRFAALLPSNEFGNAMASALTQATASAGAGTPNIRKYESSNAAISAAVRDIADYANRRGPLDAKIREARKRHDAEGRKEAAELSRESIPPPPFDNLLLADTGERLAWLSSFLPYYDIGAPTVRVMGPALWASPAARSGADLNGAWYAAPDPAARTSFDQKYQEKFSTPAPGLADLAYDAASIARVLAGSDGWSAAALTRPEGFTGVDGLLALQADGTVRRGLALFEIQRGGSVMVEPAPETMSSPGI